MREHRDGIRHQALSQQLHQLGHAPLLTATPEDYALGDWVFVPGIREAILSGRQAFDAYVVKADGSVKKTSVSTGALTEDERQIIADGCLINYYRNN